MLKFITDFGDTAYLLPGAMVILGYLVYRRAFPSAIAWATALIACATLTALLKVGFLTCGAKVRSLDVYTPSGHTSIATFFYLSVGLLVSRNRTPWSVAAIMTLAGGLAAAIAASRGILQVHTVGEVVVGSLIGTVSVIWFASRYYRAPQLGLPLTPVLGLLATLALIAHGQHLSRESWFNIAADYLRSHFAVCA